MHQPPPASLHLLINQYLEHLRHRQFSRWTIYARARQLQRFASFCQEISITSPGHVTRESIVAYQRSLCDHRTITGRALKPGSIQHYLVGVKTFLAWLVREHVLSVDHSVGLELPRESQRLPHAALTPAEVQTIFALPDVETTQGLRDRAIMEVLYSTGLRRMELCRLNLDHMDLVNGMVRVEQGKGRKDRLVPIGSEAIGWVGVI